MQVLVTGGSGFVGRHVVARLVRDGHDVVSLQRGRAAVAGARTLAIDLAELRPGDLPHGLEAVVHLAARLDNPFGVDRSLAELAAPNVVGTLRLLEAAATLDVRRFVHGSTGGVGTNAAPGGRMSEDDPPGPVNAYGLTKHLAEQAVRAYAWPFSRVSLRYFAPYGRAGSNPLFAHHLGAIERGEPIEVGRDGTPELNPIHIDDAVEATVRALAITGGPDVINVAGPDVVSMDRLITLLGEAIGRTPVIRATARHAPSWAADIDRMTRVLGAPRFGLAEGIRREFQASGR